MNRLLSVALVAAALVACKQDPASSTFVGNPTMRARIADNDTQEVISGEMDALEVLLATCAQREGGGGNEPLGPMRLSFEGDTATEPIELVPGDHCGLWFVVKDFVFTYEDDGLETTVRVDNFDLYLDIPFAAERDGSYELRFGGDTWLADLAELVDPGSEVVIYERDGTELADLFFDGLIEDSTVTRISP